MFLGHLTFIHLSSGDVSMILLWQMLLLHSQFMGTHTQIPRAYDTGLTLQSIKELSTVINSGINVTQPSQGEP